MFIVHVYTFWKNDFDWKYILATSHSKYRDHHLHLLSKRQQILETNRKLIFQNTNISFETVFSFLSSLVSLLQLLRAVPVEGGGEGLMFSTCVYNYWLQFLSARIHLNTVHFMTSPLSYWILTYFYKEIVRKWWTWEITSISRSLYFSLRRMAEQFPAIVPSVLVLGQI